MRDEDSVSSLLTGICEDGGREGKEEVIKE